MNLLRWLWHWVRRAWDLLTGLYVLFCFSVPIYWACHFHDNPFLHPWRETILWLVLIAINISLMLRLVALNERLQQ